MILASLMPKGSFRYMFMPELVSRINGLVLGGFNYIPFFMAVVYHIVRLLPANHPYINPVNIGRFGIRHVVAEAANHLVFDRRNIDKILMFFLVLCGLAILFLQIAVLLVALVFPSVMAFPTNWNGFFVVNPLAERRQDLAFIMLDMVFGVPEAGGGAGGFFESCIGVATVCEDNFGVGVIDTNTAGTAVTAASATIMGPLSAGAYTQFPFPVHLGIHRLFSVYSTGLLVIAVIIASYFIATILAETAQSGTPFGRRFNKMWAPIRLVVAFGLLIPLGTGLNSSQYLVLYAAKFGSAFATNGWKFFNNTLTENYLGAANDLVALPTLPEVGRISQALFLARVCRFAYLHSRGAPTGATVPTSGSTNNTSPEIRMYQILAQSKTPNAVEVTGGYSYDAAQTNADDMSTSLTVRFGERDTVRYSSDRGHVRPYCGEIQFQLADPRRIGAAIPPEQGPYLVQTYFWELVRDMWHYAGGNNAFEGGAVTAAGDRADTLAGQFMGVYNATTPGPGPYPDVTYVTQVNANVYNSFTAAVNNAVTQQLASARWAGSWTGADPVYRKGWAAAGIWYNRIAEMNHPITVSVHALPNPSQYPLLLEELKEKKGQYNAGNNLQEIFKPVLSGVEDTATLLEAADGQILADAMYEGYKAWSTALGSTALRPSGNPFLDAISYILGTNGLYDMRRNTNTHPLAKLVSLGRSLVQRSVDGIGFGFIVATAGIPLVFADATAPAAKMASVVATFVFTISMIGITAGFVLAYVVPFLPFLYFFFAVGGWIKGIFEAMVGAPLWALAHIRIDAQGLPGNAALNGYYLIFEVFLRPILCVFGLLAAISIYSALVSALNTTFDLVVRNAGGFDVSAEVSLAPSFIDSMRGPIDEFFFTIIYCVLVYMMGMSSFKLIDTIPNNILRWMGQSVATFGDMREDAAQGLVGRAALGAQQVTGKIGGGLGGYAGLSDPGRYK